MRNLSKLAQATVVTCAGLLLAGCATFDRDTYSSTSSDVGTTPLTESSGSQASSSSTYSSQQQTDYGESSWDPGPHIRAAREEDMQQSTSQQFQGTQQPGTASARQQSQQQTQMTQDQIVIPLHQEQLTVGKQTVDAGQVTIRKIVTTERVSQPVELRRETVIIDRRPAQGQTSATSASGFQEGAGAARAGSQQSSAAGALFEENVITIPLKQEKPVLQKRIVQTGQVVIDRNMRTEQQTVQDQVRREDVQLDRAGASGNVEVRGNFSSTRSGEVQSEAAGAERSEPQ